MTDKLKPCPWCYNHKGKSELQFTVIDDDTGQYVSEKLIKYCPFCGKTVFLAKEEAERH